MSAPERLAWSARHFGASRWQALTFRDEGNLSAARYWAAKARQDWSELQKLLGSESANAQHTQP